MSNNIYRAYLDFFNGSGGGGGSYWGTNLSAGTIAGGRPDAGTWNTGGGRSGGGRIGGGKKDGADAGVPDAGNSNPLGFEPSDYRYHTETGPMDMYHHNGWRSVPNSGAVLPCDGYEVIGPPGKPWKVNKLPMCDYDL